MRALRHTSLIRRLAYERSDSCVERFWCVIIHAAPRLPRGKLAFGEARGSNGQLASVFNVTEFPRLVAVCNGDPAASEVRRRGFSFAHSPLPLCWSGAPHRPRTDADSQS